MKGVRDTMNLYFQSISLNETLYGQRALRSFSFTHQKTSSSLDVVMAFSIQRRLHLGPGEAISSNRRQRRITCTESRINDYVVVEIRFFFNLLFHGSHESHDRARKVVQLTKMYPKFHGIPCLAGLLVVPRPRTSVKAAIGKN